MQIKKMLGIVLASLMAFGLLAGTPAAAQSPMPTSSSPAQSVWRKMNPTTFKVSPQAVLEQYDRVAAFDSRLTAEKRNRLETMLKASEGVEVMVQDGIVLDYLTGRQSGSPHVWKGMRKQLGRADRAILFDLGDGVSIYWFTGVKGVSCNNIGVVVEEIPPPTFTEQPKKKPVCKMVTTNRSTPAQGGLFISSLYLTNCCCGALYTPSLYLPGEQPDNTTQSILVCN